MLSMMVYWGEQSKKKPKTEGSLRARRQQEGIEEASVGVDVDQLVAVLHKQTELVDKQSDRISELTEALTKILDRPTQESKPQIIYIDKNSNICGGDISSVDDDLPTLKDRDVQMIDTTGIEVGSGQIGDTKTEGESIADRVAKLKEIKRGKKI